MQGEVGIRHPLGGTGLKVDQRRSPARASLGRTRMVQAGPKSRHPARGERQSPPPQRRVAYGKLPAASCRRSTMRECVGIGSRGGDSTGEWGRYRSHGSFGDGCFRPVLVHGPRVTIVQKRTGCGGIRADSADIGPEATPVGASVSSDRCAQPRVRRKLEGDRLRRLADPSRRAAAIAGCRPSHNLYAAYMMTPQQAANDQATHPGLPTSGLPGPGPGRLGMRLQRSLAAHGDLPSIRQQPASRPGSTISGWRDHGNAPRGSPHDRRARACVPDRQQFTGEHS
jgi:hypothetical protein